jgi:Trk K+ transport system NAD-binding subunit
LVRHADGNIDARLFQGNAMSIGCWREAAAAKMDYLIAVAGNDAVNMMACLIADRFAIPRKIARVRSLLKAFYPINWTYARFKPDGNLSITPDKVCDCHQCHSIAFHLTGDLIFTQFP